MAVDLVEFAVTDVETTGCMPEVNDRVVEIAVIRADRTGRPLREYMTLVNPERDLGSCRIHGLNANRVKRAPRFCDVAGDVVHMLAGAVLVGHSAVFDFRFLRSEFGRMGYRCPQVPRVCTMSLVRKADPTVTHRSLAELCRHFDIKHANPHTAYGDALATAELLRRCLEVLMPSDLGITIPPAGRESWPALPPSGISYTRSAADEDVKSEPTLLAELVAKLPAAHDLTPAVNEYLCVLDRVLEDRLVSQIEADLLQSVAQDLGLIREQVECAHAWYLQTLQEEAEKDGVLSDFEANDLETVKRILGLNHVRRAASRAVGRREISRPTAKRMETPTDELRGKRVCFTGELQCVIDGAPVDRATAERLASEKGMVVVQGVSRKLDLLVAADPESMSGKAKKAREYGIRIVAEPVFWRMIGISPQ